MISLKRYLEAETPRGDGAETTTAVETCTSLLWAYRAGLAEMADSGSMACPGLATELKKELTRVDDSLGTHPSLRNVITVRETLRDVLQNWGKKTAQHYEQKAGEVRDLLLIMSRTAESLGHRDEQYVQQFDRVTKELNGIAKLDDITTIRESVEESARALKSSVARMAAESKAVIDHLRVEVSTYQSKLEKAEHMAACDALTGLGSRRWIEARIQQRILAGLPFSIVMIDVDGFRHINHDYGNLVGDMILKEFARELRSSCRFSDLVARWGGDEFLLVLDCGGADLQGQVARLQSWICRPYTVPGRSGHLSVRLDASMGIAEFREEDSLQELLERADAALCAQQEASRSRLTA